MIDFTIETRGGFSVLVYADKSCRLAHDTEIVLFTEISRLTEEVDKERRDRCDTCGAKVSSYPNGCPTCGAPQCCQWCCKRDALQKELDEARGKVEETYSLCREYRKKLMELGTWAYNYEAWISNGDSVDVYDMVKEVKQILKGGGDE